jgi:hypothetical protein
MNNQHSQTNLTTANFEALSVANPAILGIGLLLTALAMSIPGKAEAANATTAQLQTETNARIAADTAEKTARTDADSTETKARVTADTNEAAARTAANNAETTARTNAVNTLTAALSAEQKARQNGDSTETAARQQAIADLMAKLQNQINVLSALTPAPPVMTGTASPELTLRLCPGKDTPQWERCTYKIGGTGPAGGIVFYVTDGGQHGLEVAPSLLGPALWGCNGKDIPGTDNHRVGSGAQNTKDILAGCAESGIAARLADAYSLNGFDDWYLPSLDDLYFMSVNIGVNAQTPNTNAGNFNYFYYWSSSEDGASNSWYFQFIDGHTSNQYTKSSIFYVRPVRSF